MIDFIVNNYGLILKFIMIVLELLAFLFLVFKKNKSNDVFTHVLASLPEYISYVEKSIGSGNGQLKKESVMKIAIDLYKRLTGISISDDSLLAKRISQAIEDILSTPQKKGEK